jgi:hypothetical protein
MGHLVGGYSEIKCSPEGTTAWRAMATFGFRVRPPQPAAPHAKGCPIGQFGAQVQTE